MTRRLLNNAVPDEDVPGQVRCGPQSWKVVLGYGPRCGGRRSPVLVRRSRDMIVQQPPNPVKYVLIGLLKAYRLVVSPLYGNVCRYYPSCSAYALRAVEVHGAVRGTWLAGRRLLRCHPWTPGGYDPVPGSPEWHEEQALLATTEPPAHDHSPAASGPHPPVLQRVT